MAKKIWLIKMEEDLPFDDNPFPHRMGVIADILSEKYVVTRYASQFNHKKTTVRSVSGKIRVGKNYKIVLLKALFTYSKSKILRYICFYISATQLFFAFLKAKGKPDLIICAMPTPVMCFVCALFKVFFSRKTKLVLDVRDLWPEILSDEMGHNIVSRALTFLMGRELSFAKTHADGFLGVTDFFSNHLQLPNLKVKPSQTFYLIPGSKIGSKPIPDKHLLLKYEFSNEYKITFVFGGTISKTTFTELSKFVDVIQQIPNVVLIVCGNGYFYDQLNEKVVTSNIKIMGNLPYKEFEFVKSISDFGVICVENRIDYKNSLSNKFFDYISSGLPIISNSGGLVASVIETNNIGYVYDSPTHLCEILASQHMFSDAVLNKLSKNVFDSATGIYSANNNAAKLVSFVDNLLASQ